MQTSHINNCKSSCMKVTQGRGESRFYSKRSKAQIRFRHPRFHKTLSRILRVNIDKVSDLIFLQTLFTLRRNQPAFLDGKGLYRSLMLAEHVVDVRGWRLDDN